MRKSIVAAAAVGMLAAIPVITQISTAEATGRGSGGRSIAAGTHSHRLSTGNFRPATQEAIDKFISDPRHLDSVVEIRGISAANPSRGHQVKTIDRINDGRIAVTDGDFDSSHDALARGTANVRTFSSSEEFQSWFQDWRNSVSGGSFEARMAYDHNDDPDKENIPPQVNIAG